MNVQKNISERSKFLKWTFKNSITNVQKISESEEVDFESLSKEVVVS